MGNNVSTVAEKPDVRALLHLTRSLIEVYGPSAEEGEKAMLRRAQIICDLLEDLLYKLDLELDLKEFMNIIVNERLFSEEICEDWKDLLELEPGWASNGEGTEHVSEEAIITAAFTLLVCFLLDCVPRAIVASPLQSINLKWEGYTVIILGPSDLRVFNETTCETTRYSLSSIFQLLRARMESTWTVIHTIGAWMFGQAIQTVVTQAVAHFILQNKALGHA
jgi:hypothetical protein